MLSASLKRGGIVTLALPAQGACASDRLSHPDRIHRRVQPKMWDMLSPWVEGALLRHFHQPEWDG